MFRSTYLTLVFCLFLSGLFGQGIQLGSGVRMVSNGKVHVIVRDANFTNNGQFDADSSTVSFQGNTAAVIGGSSTSRFHRLRLENSAANHQLSNDIEIDSSLAFGGGMLDLKGYKVTLVGDGQLSGESPDSRIMDTLGGEVIKTISLNAPTNANPGKLGLSITSTDDLGLVTVRRGHKPMVINNGNSIQRYYKVKHTGASNASADYTFHYLNNERNGANEAWLKPWTFDTKWNQRDAAAIDTALNTIQVTGATISDTLWAFTTGMLQVHPRIFLEGNYSSGTGLMTDHLRSNGLIPTTEPYTDLSAFTHVNGGGETIDPSVLNVTGDSAIVDWVFLEVRNPADSTQVIQTASALLQANGRIVDLDGVSPAKIPNLPSDDFYLVVRHRNHLAIRTPTKLTLTPVDNADYDFTTGLGQAWDKPGVLGNDAMVNSGGVFLLHRANISGDNFVNILDFLQARQGSTPIQSNVYLSADVNLDRFVNILDVIQTRQKSTPIKAAHID